MRTAITETLAGTAHTASDLRTPAQREEKAARKRAWTHAELSTLSHEPSLALRQIHARGWDELPVPGRGETLARWRALAAVSGWDLCLAKLFEAHTDARAILCELDGGKRLPSGLGCVWAAEVPGTKVTWAPEAAGKINSAHKTDSSDFAEAKGFEQYVTLTGRKAWCSGGDCLDWALLTVWSESDGDGTSHVSASHASAPQPWLAWVDLHQAGVEVTTDGWHAVGMSRVKSGDVVFRQAKARLIGAPGDYLHRPGFWHGGAGIAACWYGAAVSLGHALLERAYQDETKQDETKRGKNTGGKADSYRLAHLGAVDIALSQARSLVMHSAASIDAAPLASAQQTAMRLRASCEAAAEEVLHAVGRALGATPYCKDARFAQMVADLPVFLRQSHAEKDLAALARLLLQPQEKHNGTTYKTFAENQGDAIWTL